MINNINKQKINIIESTQQEMITLEYLGKDYIKYSEMSDQDRVFLNTLVLRKQPKKILELGVCSGGSSLVILNAIKNTNDAYLYSIDYNTKHYRLKDKLTGFYVDNFPELKEKWTLKTGGLALEFMEEIGGDIDFCFIDTVHSNPGEILDFLMVLPYLKKNATVVFHDINLHTRTQTRPPFSQWQITNGVLMSSIIGKKLLPADEPFKSNTLFANIGAIELNDLSFEHIWEIFNLLTIKWQYMLPDEEIKKLSCFISDTYGENYKEYFEKVVLNQKEIRFIDKTEISYTQKLSTLEKGIKELNNKLNQQKYSILEKLFSVKTQNKHKVIMILGIKIKFKKRGA